MAGADQVDGGGRLGGLVAGSRTLELEHAERTSLEAQPGTGCWSPQGMRRGPWQEKVCHTKTTH